MKLIKKNIILDKILYNNEIITYEYLESLPEDVVISIIPDDLEAIQTTKLKQCKEDTLYFRVSMKKDSVWKYHKHDCKETIALYKGELFDNITSDTLYRGGLLFVPAYKLHSFTALEDSTFYVEFEKPTYKK